MSLKYGPSSFVQDKWDAAGATQACIRVIARRSGTSRAWIWSNSDGWWFAEP